MCKKALFCLKSTKIVSLPSFFVPLRVNSTEHAIKYQLEKYRKKEKGE